MPGCFGFLQQFKTGFKQIVGPLILRLALLNKSNFC
nr:MAG TPA: hypothetical protein [Caudoviricetes sp.]